MNVIFGTGQKHLYRAVVKGVPSNSERRKPTVLFDIYPLNDGENREDYVFTNITVKQAKALRNALKKAIKEIG